MTNSNTLSDASVTSIQQQQGRARLLRWTEQYALIGLMILVVVVFSFLPASGEAFRTVGNMQAVLGNLSVVTVVALALVIPLVAGNLDFTVGAAAGISSVVVGSLMSNSGAPLAVAVIAGLLSGIAIGCVNGVVVAILGVNSFISTLGFSILLGGLVQWYTGGIDIISGIDRALTGFGSGVVVPGLPQTFILVVLITLACWFVLTNTPYGRKLRAVGSNARAATLVGLNARRVVFLSFVISGLLAGIAGVLLVARNGGAVTGAGAAQLFPAFAAVFLGATAIEPGRYNAIGTFLGVAFVAIAVSGLTLAGAASWVPAVFNGATLMVAVIISTLLARQRRREA